MRQRLVCGVVVGGVTLQGKVTAVHRTAPPGVTQPFFRKAIAKKLTAQFLRHEGKHVAGRVRKGAAKAVDLLIKPLGIEVDNPVFLSLRIRSKGQMTLTVRRRLLTNA